LGSAQSGNCFHHEAIETAVTGDFEAQWFVEYLFADWVDGGFRGHNSEFGELWR
jgi:hypothetical protein